MPIHFAFALAFLNTTNVLGSRVLLTLYALDAGAPPVAIGLLATTFALFPTLLSWYTGRLSDRFGSRWPLLLGTTGTGVGMLVPYFVPGLPAISVAAAMSGLSMTFYVASIQNLVGHLSKPDQRARNFSTYTLMLAIAGFVGPLAVGFLIDQSGYKATLLCLATLSCVPVAMLLLWGSRLPGGTRVTDAPVESVRDTLLNPKVWPVLVASSLAQSGTDIFKFYMPVYAHTIGLSASAIGALLGMPAIAGFIARLSLPHLIARFGEEKVLVYAFGLGMTGFLLVPLFKITAVLALISFLFGLGMYCCQPITMMLMFDRSAAGQSGEALGLRMTADNITKLVGPVLFGLIGSSFGLAAVFWVNALMLGSGSLMARARASAHAGRQG